jgi:CheY-like chemotaxis protein
MNIKRILVVDDEESILTLLERSLKTLNPDYQIVTVNNGFDALNHLEQTPFDIVITDYHMAEMDGLELLEATRYVNPKTRIIVMTGYDDKILEAETKRLKAHSFLIKPIQLDKFYQVIREALETTPRERTGILVLSNQQYQTINDLLEQLRQDVSARCIFLAGAQGHIIARVGSPGQVHMEEITSLLGGGLATLSEAGRVLDGDQEAINLAYHEGKQENLYALNIGQQFLLVLIVNRGPYSSRLGTVWYYAQQVALTLRETIAEDHYLNPQRVFSSATDQHFNTELDKLFTKP